MTQNGEDTRGRGYRGGGGGGGHRAAGKANPPRYREEEERRASSSSNQRGGASVRASGGSYENGNTTPHDDQLDEDGNIVGEVDYTDGEMGSVSSSFASSPQSSVGSGGGRRGVTSGGSGGNGSTQNRGRNKNESPGASFSPSSSNGAGGGHSGGTGGRRRSDGVQPIPGVSARPAGVPFGASALSKTMPNNGRGRPRGLRPRSSGAAAGTPGSTTSSRGPSFSALGRQGSAASGLSAATAGGNALARRGTPSASFREAEARAAELLAPGVPVDVVVRAAIKIESVMRVLIARGYVRRKLVSEVTAFSLIMERGIEVIKVRGKLCVYVCVCVCAVSSVGRLFHLASLVKREKGQKRRFFRSLLTHPPHARGCVFFFFLVWFLCARCSLSCEARRLLWGLCRALGNKSLSAPALVRPL